MKNSIEKKEVLYYTKKVKDKIVAHILKYGSFNSIQNGCVNILWGLVNIGLGFSLVLYSFVLLLISVFVKPSKKE